MMRAPVEHLLAIALAAPPEPPTSHQTTMRHRDPRAIVGLAVEYLDPLDQHHQPGAGWVRMQPFPMIPVTPQ